MRKESLFGTFCSVAAGIYFVDFFREKKEERSFFNLLLGIAYLILAAGWVIVDSRNIAEDRKA